jgi:hypothetical protein
MEPIVPTLAKITPFSTRIWDLGRVLWVCRVPIGSTLLAGALLAVTPQGRDLFADLGITWWQWAFFYFLCFSWAWIVHGSARRALQCDDWVPEAHASVGISMNRRQELRKEFGFWALWVPRLLGVAVLLLVGWAMCRTWRNMKGAAAALQEASSATHLSLVLLIVLVSVIALFAVLIRRRRIWITTTTMACLEGRTPICASWFGPVPTQPPLTRTDKFIIGAGIIILLFVVASILFPLFMAGWMPRLFFVPLVFSGIVLFLGEIASWSHRKQTPLLLALVVISVITINVVDRFHDVRWVQGHPAVTSVPRQITFKTAVERWMAANGCSAEAVSECPRPILIAGAGGASRAAFLTASVVGALLDLDNANGLSQNRADHIRPRIFAMSTVSGSSVGGAVIRAAMLDSLAGERPEFPPCKDEGTGSWYGTWARMHLANSHFEVKTSWRDCFQAILAGDFLSPALIGVFYRDNFPIPNPFTWNALWGDRAELLEEAFEARYHRMTVGGRSVTCRDFAEDEQAKSGEESGLCRRFGYHPAVDSGPEAWKQWVPLLFFNSTSVATGRRIITSDIPIGEPYLEKPRRTLMPFAYDLWQLR